MLTEIIRILRFEPARIKSNPVAILGIALSLLFFFVVTVNIGKNAQEISLTVQALEGAQQAPNAGIIASLIDDTLDSAPLTIIRKQSALLGLFFIVTIWATPFMAMLLASDQVAAELSRKHIRFLLPRVSRTSLFVGRAIGAWLTWTALVAVVCVIVAQVLTAVGGNENPTTNFVLGFRMVATLSIYGMPFVCLMAFWNSFLTNSFLSYLLAIVTWIVVATVSTVGSWANPVMENAKFLMPTVSKYAVMSSEPGVLLSGVLGCLAYSAVFFSCGLWIFKTRDV